MFLERYANTNVSYFVHRIEQRIFEVCAAQCWPDTLRNEGALVKTRCVLPGLLPTHSWSSETQPSQGCSLTRSEMGFFRPKNKAKQIAWYTPNSNLSLATSKRRIHVCLLSSCLCRRQLAGSNREWVLGVTLDDFVNRLLRFLRDPACFANTVNCFLSWFFSSSSAPGLTTSADFFE